VSRAGEASRPGCSGSEELLAANLAALGGRFPELAALVSAAGEGGLELAPAASGEMSARSAAGSWLHSSRDPRAEARRLASACLSGGADLALILGFGLGYGAEACLEAGAEAVLVCEADPSALRAAFGARDLRALLADERIGFIAGGEPESVVSALELSGGALAGLLENKAAAAAAPQWFERARASFERWNAKGQINEGTLRRFGRLWVRNLARNVGAVAESAGVERLEGLCSGAAAVQPGGATAVPLPAIVLAAGPSLDEALPRIREISRRVLVVCVDTALRSLLRYGVEPDFLVVVDPQYWNWRHLAGLEAPAAFLVSESAAWPAVLRARRRGTFLGGSLFPLGRRIEELAGVRGRLGAGGSVATSAWDLCRLLGCAPVWMAGLDLSYPEGRTHAKASLFEQRALAEGGRLAPAASAQAGALVGGQSFDAFSAEGGRVRTDKRMSLYAWWFESRLSRPSSPPTISLSSRGLAIAGMPTGGLEELLALPDRRPEIEDALERAAAALPAEPSRERTGRGLEELLVQLERIAAAAEGALAAARAGREAFAAGGDPTAALESLAKADGEILSLEARDVAGFLLPALRELAGKKARDLGESFAQSEALYGSLAESARYHLSVLARAGEAP
jgi:hypothetical protein